MKRYKINTLRIFVILVSAIMIFGLIFILPKIANYFQEIAPEYGNLKLPLMIGIYATGIPFFIAVYNIFKLFKMVEEDNVFNEGSIGSLNTIGRCALVEIILYALGLVYLYVKNAMQPGIILICFFIMFTGLVIYIFIEIVKELLIQVLEIKTENELTI